MLNNKQKDRIEPTIDELEMHFTNLSRSDNADVFEPEPEIHDNNINNSNDDLLNSPISKQEIEHACTNLRNNKSPGEDGILNEYIKCSLPIISM